MSDRSIEGQSSQAATSERQLMEEIAMLFSGNQGCNFDKTGDYTLLLLIKESVQDMKKKVACPCTCKGERKNE